MEEEKVGDKSGGLPDQKIMQSSQENNEEKVNDVEYGEYQMFEEKKISTLSLSAKMKQPHEAVIALRNSGIF